MENEQARLRNAWDQMIGEIEKARDAIDNPSLYPPPPTDRNLAEGYRYLLGFLYGAIDRALTNPDYPYLRRAIQPVDKATIDNADAIYLCTEIDGNNSYLVKGKAQDYRHWRGEDRTPSGRKAPQYVIFEVTNAYAGDSGNIMELMPGSRVNTGTLDSSNLMVEADDNIERPGGSVTLVGYGESHLGDAASRTSRARFPGLLDVSDHQVGAFPVLGWRLSFAKHALRNLLDVDAAVLDGPASAVESRRRVDPRHV